MKVIYNCSKYYINYLTRNNICRICHCVNYSSVSPNSDNQQTAVPKVEFIKNKIYNFMRWYEHLTGLDEIRNTQNKVIEAQDRFAAAQEKRREVSFELNDVKTKIKDLQEELSTTSRGEERYIALITKEHKFLKEEIRLIDKFNLYEREERELFTTLTSAVKDSHEKERIQANKTKYLSIIGSIVGALIGITGSTLNNRSKLAGLKQMVLQTTEEEREKLAAVCEQLKSASTNLNLSRNDEEPVNRTLSEISDFLKQLDTTILKNKNLELSVNRTEKNVNTLVQYLTKIPVTIDKDETSPAFDSFANVKDDVSYVLISCFSVYFLYKLFFS